MRLPLDQRFHDERARFRLHCTCQQCAYFDAPRLRCAHGYPTETHSDAAFDRDGASKGMFCKEFELA